MYMLMLVVWCSNARSVVRYGSCTITALHCRLGFISHRDVTASVWLTAVKLSFIRFCSSCVSRWNCAEVHYRILSFV